MIPVMAGIPAIPCIPAPGTGSCVSDTCTRFGGSPGPQQGLRERIRFAPGAVEADVAEAAMGRFEPIFRACVHVAP